MQVGRAEPQGARCPLSAPGRHNPGRPCHHRSVSVDRVPAAVPSAGAPRATLPTSGQGPPARALTLRVWAEHRGVPAWVVSTCDCGQSLGLSLFPSVQWGSWSRRPCRLRERANGKTGATAMLAESLPTLGLEPPSHPQSSDWGTCAGPAPPRSAGRKEKGS